MHYKFLPNFLTLSRIFISPLFIFAMLKSSMYYKILSFCIFLIGSFSDFLDGYLARKYNNVSKIGMYIDPLADKIFIFSGFVILHYYYPGIVKLWMILAIVFRDFLVMFLRSYLINTNKNLITSYFAKLKTLFQIICIHIFLFFHIYNPKYIYESHYFYLLMVGVVSITILTSFSYIRSLLLNDNK